MWNIKNIDNLDILEIEDKSVIEPLSSVLSQDWNKLANIREVFYITPKETGEENLLLRLSDFNNSSSASLFDINVHVNITK